MQRLLIFAVTGLTLSSLATHAADLGRAQPYVYRPLAYDWSGFHVGLTGGAAFNGNDPSFGFVNIDPADLDGIPRSAPLSSQGGLIGGEIGYDIQLGGWVVGVEGDLSWTNFGDSATTIVPGNSGGGGGRPQLTFATSEAMAG